jgi:hypothetical protein
MYIMASSGQATVKFYMLKKPLALFVFTISLLGNCPQAFAHHGTAAYDEKNPITLKGTVTDFVWANPHSLIKVDVKDDKGNVVHWVAETFPPGKLARDGWTRNIVKPGDEVTVTISPAKDGSLEGLLRVLVLPDSRELGPDAPH